MIKRINVFKGVGRFTSLKSTSGTQGDFSNLNVIYAPNSCGKSTLCDVFRSLTTGNPSYILGRKKLKSTTQPEIIFLLEGGQTTQFKNNQWYNHDLCLPIHIYDERFVAENVFVGHHISIDQRRNLYGLVMGDQAIELQQSVSNSEEQLTKATNELKTTQTILTSLIPDGYNIESFRNIGTIDNVDTKITDAKIELRTAVQTKSKADAILARKILSTLPIAQVPETLATVLSSTFDTATLAAEEKIKEHLANSSKGLPIDWVKQGYESQNGTICPHCGQEMDGLAILESYHSYFSGELQAQEHLREFTKVDIYRAFGETAQNRLSQLLISHATEQSWWKDVAEYVFTLPNIGNNEDIISLLEDAYQVFDSALGRKQVNPGSKIVFTENELSTIDAWNKKAIELQTYNEALNVINTDLQSQKTKVGEINLTIIQQLLSQLMSIKKRFEQETIDVFKAYDAAVNQQSLAQKAKQQANGALREHSKILFDQYGKRINELLKLFGVNFEIINDGVSFRGGPPSGQLAIKLCGERVSDTPESASDPSQASFSNTLSGGDRSALALSFFLAKTEMASDVDKSIVVFDDPYFSQDRSRRQCTIGRINHLAGLAKQCFVFSHDLDFAHSVERCFGNQTKTFIIDPLIDPSILKAQQLPSLPSQTYLKSYQLLSSYLECPAEQLQHLKEVAATLRTILEDYFRIKFPKAWEEKDWLGEMIRKIREAQTGMPLFYCQSLVEELSLINKYSSPFHHGGTGSEADEPEVIELNTFVQRTLNVIHAGGHV